VAVSRDTCQAVLETAGRNDVGLTSVGHHVVGTVVQMTVETTQEAERTAAADHTCPTRVIDAERVAVTRAQGVDGDAAGAVANLFKLLGDPGRVRMLDALARAGELCVCDLAAVVDMAESPVSHSLRLLRNAGVVRPRRAGRQVFYRLDDDHVRLLLELSVEHVSHGPDGR
jgi:ArsR family transcriptional regulator, lead/cadmium/zinc/bismuth-responsive transcriptional repressor